MDNKISIIIPAYNIDSCLEATLESVRAQTWTNIEVIVVNDGSTDRTASVMDVVALRDNRIKTIHKENGGVTSARLRGVAEATGQWIGFVDGDDLLEADMFERLLKNAEQYGADISHCGYQMVFPDGHIDYYYNTGRLVVQQDRQGCADLLEGSFTEPGLWNKLYCRELFVGLDDWMDQTIRINEDLLMNFYLFRGAKSAVFEDACLYHYVLRRGSAATSRLNRHKLEDPIRVLYRLLEETKDDPAWNAIVEKRLIYQLINTATMSTGTQKALITPVRALARKTLRQRFWRTLGGTACTTKLKIMATWAAIWPSSYGWVHHVYAKLTRLDKKYEIK